MSSFSVVFDLAAKNSLSKTFSRLGKDSKGLTKSLGGVSSSVTDLRDKLGNVKKIEKAHDGYRSLSRAVDVARDELKDMRREVSRSESPTRRATEALRRKETQVKKLASSLERKRHVIKNTSQALRDQGVDLRRLRTEEKALAGALEKTISLEKKRAEIRRRRARGREALGLSSGSVTSAAMIYGGGRGVAAGRTGLMSLANPVGVAADFEAEMSAVKTYSKATEAEMARLSGVAKRLGANTSFGLLEVASGQTVLAKAGLSPSQIAGSTGGVLDIAKAGGVGIREAAEISTSIVNQFGLDVSRDVGLVGDTLAALSSATQTNFSELSYVFEESGGVAASTGVSLSQLAGMTKILADNGLRASKAGTSLKNVLLNLSSPTSSGAKALDTLGVATKTVDGGLRSMPEVLTDISASLEGLGEQERIGLLSAVSGREALPGFLALISGARRTRGETGRLSSALSEAAGAFEAVDGEAKRQAKSLDDNTRGSLKNFSSKLESLSNTMGELLLPSFDALVNKGASALHEINQFASENKTLAKVLGLAAAGAAGLVVAGGALVTVIGGVGLAVTSVNAGLAVLGASVTAGGLLSSAVAGLGAVASAFLSPFLLIPAAVAGLGYLAWQFDSVRESVTGAWEATKDFVGLGDEGGFLSDLFGAEKDAPTPAAQAANGAPFQFSSTINLNGGSVDEQKLSRMLREEMEEASKKMRGSLF